MAERMLDHLAAVARQARENAGLRQIDIATTAGVSHASVSKFERAVSWPQNPDRMIDAYAAETGRAAIELWTAAARRAASTG